MRKDHQRYVQECLARAVFLKVLDTGVRVHCWWMSLLSCFLLALVTVNSYWVVFCSCALTVKLQKCRNDRFSDTAESSYFFLYMMTKLVKITRL